ncbi:hypothetical protein [Streptomyces sp. TR02-1]|uniref:hypothetical protein n=1 Tax=Streptomyces sp. TR02-1 TaxID=3385977 RepID=UPI0039A37DC0
MSSIALTQTGSSEFMGFEVGFKAIIPLFCLLMMVSWSYQMWRHRKIDPEGRWVTGVNNKEYPTVIVFPVSMAFILALFALLYLLFDFVESNFDGQENDQLVPGLMLSAAFGVVTWAYKRWRSKRNLPRYQALARRYGGSFALRAKARSSRFPHAEWRLRGEEYDVQDFLSGSHQGFRFHCATWEYAERGAISDGDSDPVHVVRSVFTMELPGYFGWFSVCKHSKVRAAFRQSDVEVGHSEFDEQFTVRADDPSSAQQTLRGPVVDFLLNDSRSRDYPLWFLGDRLVCSYKSRLTPKHVEPTLDYMVQLIGHLGQGTVGGEDTLADDVVPVAN